AFREQAFDLVLMDMQMPVMDGLTATREIRDHEASTGGNRTPIVMLTANALAEHVAASHEAGADTHLSKPFSAEALLGLVAAAAAQVGERLRAAA
ncbi:MAG: response regulator, partial [Caulobacteraceae bacterium]